MNEQEISDIVIFETRLARLILKRKWAHEYTEFTLHKGKSTATVSGLIKLTDTHLLGSTHEEVTNDARHQIAHLITGIAHKHDFSWQFIANKILHTSPLIALRAKETQECEYCNTLTALTHPPRCTTCKKIEDAVKLNPEVAALILERIQ